MPGLYLHIPFCEKKCIYCDFYSIESSSMMESFLRSLHHEVDLYTNFGHGGVVFDTIYFGGGTPSLLSPPTIGRILDHVQRNFVISTTAEVTLETNPGTVDFQKLKEFREVGINRLSVGIQSFDDHDLEFLSRIHTAEEAKKCILVAQEVGFENLSLDLIYALPGQRLKAWEKNLETAVSFSPKHISAYSLIVEDGTPLARMVECGQVSPAGEGVESEMFLFTMEYLAGQGYEHYEVSNYAMPGYRSRHNSLYWSHDSYLGFGPSAHSFWSGESLQKPARWWNVASIGRYCEMLAGDSAPVAGRECLEKGDLLTEEIFLALRTGGIDLHKLQKEFGISLFDRHSEKLSKFVQEELLTLDRDEIRLTAKGFLFCDGLALDLTA
jgi:oxygen-independent coproporphyrinogen-3 oxidase